eukprot:2737749-Rhodomonas_salina.2
MEPFGSRNLLRNGVFFVCMFPTLSAKVIIEARSAKSHNCCLHPGYFGTRANTNGALQKSVIVLQSLIADPPFALFCSVQRQRWKGYSGSGAVAHFNTIYRMKFVPCLGILAGWQVSNIATYGLPTHSIP